MTLTPLQIQQAAAIACEHYGWTYNTADAYVEDGALYVGSQYAATVGINVIRFDRVPDLLRVGSRRVLTAELGAS